MGIYGWFGMVDAPVISFLPCKHIPSCGQHACGFHIDFQPQRQVVDVAFVLCYRFGLLVPHQHTEANRRTFRIAVRLLRNHIHEGRCAMEAASANNHLYGCFMPFRFPNGRRASFHLPFHRCHRRLHDFISRQSRKKYKPVRKNVSTKERNNQFTK